MDGYMTLRDFGWLAVFITIVVVGVFLVRVLINLGGALGALNKLIGKNAASIDRLLKALPAISENAVSITDAATDVVENLRNEQELIESVIENVGDTIESVSETARAINEDFIGSIKRLAKTLMTVTGFLTRKKRTEAAPSEPEKTAAADASVTVAAGGASVEYNGVPESVRASDLEKKTKKPRKRTPVVRRKFAEKGRNISIQIR
jgi:uncharacterized protein YoxC